MDIGIIGHILGICSITVGAAFVMISPIRKRLDKAEATVKDMSSILTNLQISIGEMGVRIEFLADKNGFKKTE